MQLLVCKCRIICKPICNFIPLLTFELPNVWIWFYQTVNLLNSHRYYRGAVGALVLYDITKPATFENLDKWISELKEHADPCVCIMIVGNKTDLRSQRVVSTEDGRLLAGTDPSRHLISSPCILYLHNYSLSPLFQIIPTLCSLLPNPNPFPPFHPFSPSLIFKMDDIKTYFWTAVVVRPVVSGPFVVICIFVIPFDDLGLLCTVFFRNYNVRR